MSKVRVSKGKLWKAIRQQCVACFGGQSRLVGGCTSPKCSLYPYRFGRADIGAEMGAETPPNSDTADGENVKF